MEPSSIANVDLEFSGSESEDSSSGDDNSQEASDRQEMEKIQEAITKVKLNRAFAIKQSLLHHNQQIADLYDFGEKIGEGSFGKVYKATHKQTGLERAIKIIKKKKIGSSIKQTISEIENLKKVDHPNIVKLYEIYESEKSIFLVQELLFGE